MRMEVDFTMTKRNKHIGSSLNSFLKEEGILEETRAIALKAAVVVQDAEAYQRLLDIRAQFVVAVRKNNLEDYIDSLQTHIKFPFREVSPLSAA
jgi:hypothetical protein